MVVAFAATERRPQPGATHIPDAFGDVLGKIFLGLHAPLGTHHAESVIAGGDFVFDCRFGSRSPANCSSVKRSNGLSSLNDLIT